MDVKDLILKLWVYRKIKNVASFGEQTFHCIQKTGQHSGIGRVGKAIGQVTGDLTKLDGSNNIFDESENWSLYGPENI